MSFKVIIDSREQTPYSFAGYGVEVETGTLNSGDYSIAGLESLVAVERKELSDFIGCCTQSRERFKNELMRLRGYRAKAVVIEGTLEDIIKHRYRSQILPQSVIGSISSWTLRYEVPFVFAGDRTGGEMMTFSILKNFWQQCLEFVKSLNLKEA